VKFNFDKYVRQLFLFTCLLPIPSYADWQWTKWGMGVDGVIAGSGATIRPFERNEAPNFDKHLLASGGYSTLGMDFDANFYFNKVDRGLSMVELRLKEANFSRCLSLQNAMRDVYGQPHETHGIALIKLRTFMWRDEKTKNRVLLSAAESPDSCGLQYTPLVDKAKSGL
jgi:hypothetical protein